MAMFTELFWLLLIDAIFLVVCCVALYPLAAMRPAAFAVLKRNFLGYFANPTGYVFLCLFVLLTSFAAFWPHEFFASNLANLDQLNRYLPYIMLVFIPAITMSIWSEERRQGTDELLLTQPANDFDIVIGKYLAAAAIFTSSLLFSQIANYTVLIALSLGNLDSGLLLATYMGYWMVGLSMLAIGMVASFLTSNLTVGFILGALFNAPLVFADAADLIIPDRQIARWLSRWSLSAQFDNFGRGVISLASVVFFMMLVVLGLYLAMVLIGRRHWLGGRDGKSMLWHFIVRSLALVGLVIGVNLLFSNHDARRDITEGRVSSLSRDSLTLLASLVPEYPVYIDAFIGDELPEQYVQTRYDLNSMLKEFASRAGDKLVVNVRDGISTFSEEAQRAERRYGIQPQSIVSRSRGSLKEEQVLLGASFRCGMEKVVVPFFDFGVPVEYELVRSIVTVAQNKRPKLGVVRTAASLMGGFSMATGQMTPKQDLITELEKQYLVEEVDLTTRPDPGAYAALLVVQPSSLPPEQLDNLIAVIQQGQPTAIFEDPRPLFMQVPATSEPVMAGGGGGMFGMGGQPQPKGDIQRLWDVLGIEAPGRPGPMGFSPDIAWQNYNPYPIEMGEVNDSWVFASTNSLGGENSLSPGDPVTSGIKEVLLVAPGAIKKAPDADLQFSKLVSTGERAGRMRFEDFMESRNDPLAFQARQGQTLGEQVLAARIRGEAASDVRSMAGQDPPTPTTGKPAEPDTADTGDTADAADKSDSVEKSETADKSDAIDATPAAATPSAKPAEMNVIYIADVDCLFNGFFRMRARPDRDNNILQFNFENVTFLLNVVDSLAGVSDYLEIRKRKPFHATLQMVEVRTDRIRNEELEQRARFQEELQKAEAIARTEMDDAIKKFQESYDELVRREQAGEEIDQNEKVARATVLESSRRVAQRRFDVQVERLKNEQNQKYEAMRREYDLEVERIQNEYKVWAIALPPIPPLLVGVVVFFRRRLREREGVSKSRLV